MKISFCMQSIFILKITSYFLIEIDVFPLKCQLKHVYLKVDTNSIMKNSYFFNAKECNKLGKLIFK